MGKLLVKFFRSTYWWLHILLILGSVATLMPFILMLATSLKTPAEVLTTTPVLLPQAWRWENYVDAVNQIPFLRFYWNTIFVTVCRVVGQLLLAGPALGALGLLITLWSWNDFLWPLIITSSTDMQMLSVGLAYFQGQYITNYTVMMAAATLASLPMFIIFALTQKSLIEGITMSGMKQ